MKRAELLNSCVTFIKKIPDNFNYITPPALRNILTKSPQSIFVLDMDRACCKSNTYFAATPRLWCCRLKVRNGRLHSSG